MIKALIACLLIYCLLSCTFKTRNTGQVFVNQDLIERNIQAVQPAQHIAFAIETTDNHDSVLVISLTVDPKIPDDSLNAWKARLIMSSFVTILPDQNLRSLSSCKIIFLKKEGSFSTRSIGFAGPITPELVTKVANYKDSSKVSIGYINPDWAYVNKELNLSLPLKAGWFYTSEEHDSLVYYGIGSDINQLPQFRTDTDRKVTFITLRSLDPGNAYPVLQLTKKNESLMGPVAEKNEFRGPFIFAGLVLNRFDSEDEYLQELYMRDFAKKIPKKEIETFHFGNVYLRGKTFAHPDKDGKQIYFLSAIKRLKKVSLMLNLKYSNNKELNDIENELSGLNINQVPN
jgi:hypothetical protein